MTTDPRKSADGRAAEVLESDAPGVQPSAPESPGPPAPDSPDANAPESTDASAPGDGAASSDLAEDGAEEAPVNVAALTEQAAKAGEYLALAQRTQADFENYRKRSIREVAAAQARGVAKLAKELLPAVDNIDRALAAAEAAAAAAGEGDEIHAQLVSGIKLVHADVISAFARAGIEPFSPVGEPFDPQFHEAVAQQPFEGAVPGSVVEVYQRGYKLGEAVLRPARVLVAA